VGGHKCRDEFNGGGICLAKHEAVAHAWVLHEDGLHGRGRYMGAIVPNSIM
jgi:hypothetical protein